MMYKEFIHNLFDSEKSFIDYYDAWCANIIQFPANRSCVCLVLYSNDEGVGEKFSSENMSTKTLELCIGTNYVFHVSEISSPCADPGTLPPNSPENQPIRRWQLGRFGRHGPGRRRSLPLSQPGPWTTSQSCCRPRAARPPKRQPT